MKKILVVGILLGSIAMLQGCGPAYVVRERPVSSYSYARPKPPGPGHVWIEGSWYRSGGRYVQRPGYWSAPKRNKVYKQGNWYQRNNKNWHYKKGGWRRN
jgi:hypothetical protein